MQHLKQVSDSSLQIGECIKVEFSKIMYKKGKSENGDWTCFELWFESLEDTVLIKKLYRPSKSIFSRATYALFLETFIDCLEGKGFWKTIPRKSSWVEFETFIESVISKHVGEEFFIKTLVEKDYFDPTKVTAVLPDTNFISREPDLVYTPLEKSQVQDYYVKTQKW